MLTQGLGLFSGRRVLLLQGPVGPFFSRLAADLRQAGAAVHKVNFNAGDWLFYPRGASHFRGTMDEWPAYMRALVDRFQIDLILLFGDCRPIHLQARAVAADMKVDVGVFEEGYLRPDHVTLERGGVNGFSTLPKDPRYYESGFPGPKPTTQRVGNAYWPMVRFAAAYFFVGALGKLWFPHYQHHRPLSLWEGLPWLRSAWRKQWYRWMEREVQTRLTGPEGSERYFLVPLQVFNDSQVINHAAWASVEHFIEATLHSFAQHAPPDKWLVFKHHPMDRGYKDYRRQIRQWARQAGVENRVFYIHDQHLPSLLEHALGVVVVNSTVGLSALFHKAPVKVCGQCVYDIAGLTYQGTLEHFWRNAAAHPPQAQLYENFRSHLIARTQINGSFYKPMPLPGVRTGMVWDSYCTNRLAAVDFSSAAAPAHGTVTITESAPCCPVCMTESPQPPNCQARTIN
ncbi:MAG: capsular biosynthesis protein [Pseudomonadota bacterium]|nr:capsular biosynthesis protein [Pseudomonadota bacterium]